MEARREEEFDQELDKITSLLRAKVFVTSDEFQDIVEARQKYLDHTKTVEIAKHEIAELEERVDHLKFEIIRAEDMPQELRKHLHNWILTIENDLGTKSAAMLQLQTTLDVLKEAFIIAFNNYGGRVAAMQRAAEETAGN